MVHENRSTDGGALNVKKTVRRDGTVRTVEHRYDANGRLVAAREHEITADGAVRLVAQSGRISGLAALARAKGPEPAPRETASDEADREHIQAWLNAKFKEWNSAVEAQEAARARSRAAGRD
jgi:hypothetical protein